MPILIDSIYIHFAKSSKSFYILNREEIEEFPEIHSTIQKLVRDLNQIKAIKNYDYKCAIYFFFIITLLLFCGSYYYLYVSILAMFTLLLTLLFSLFRYKKNTTIDETLENIVFEHQDELKKTFSIKIKDSDIFMEFRKKPCIVLRPHSPFKDIYKNGGLSWLHEDKDHKSCSSYKADFNNSQDTKKLIQKEVFRFNQRKERLVSGKEGKRKSITHSYMFKIRKLKDYEISNCFYFSRCETDFKVAKSKKQVFAIKSIINNWKML